MTETNNSTIIDRSFKKAIGGGLSGSIAMFFQISTLMWLRTTMNYQYRYGYDFKTSISNLYNDGGIKRFYRGYLPALAVAPLSRFGDVASNTYITNYFKNNNNIPIPIQTLIASSIAASWRVFLVPIDTIKTSLQVEGTKAIPLLKNKVKNNGFRIMYNGSIASLSASFVGHYPWFLTYNFLNQNIEKPSNDENGKKFLRNGLIGFSSSIVSDSCSNSLRVLKTSKQTYPNNIGYLDIGKDIIKNDGLQGLMGRGLKTRILTNGLQGMIFTIGWKYFEEKIIKTE